MVLIKMTKEPVKKKFPFGKTCFERVERLRNLFRGIVLSCNYIKTIKNSFGTVCKEILI